MVSRFLLSVSFFLTALCLFSQDQEMNPIVVTGNLSAQRSRETGRNILVVGNETIRNLPVHSLDDLLKFLPGIEVQQRGPQGAQADIVIRGGTFQQVLVVIDGVRLNDPLTGHFNSYIPIHPGEIDRIEILKGAASAIFGPDAVGGVIHVITKNFQKKYMEEGSSLQASVQPGSYGMFNTAALGRLQGKKSYVSLGYQQQKADGSPLRGTTGFFNNRVTVLSAGANLNKGWSILLRGAFDRRFFNAQNFYTPFVSDTANERVNSNWQQVYLTQKREKATLEILGALKQLEDVYAFRPGVAPNRNKTQLANFQVNHIYKVAEKLTWLNGVQSFAKTIRSNDRGNHDHLHIGFFSGLTHSLPSGITLSESIRADWDQSYKWVWIPQLNFSWSPSWFTLRSSIGKTVRDADFTERYNNFNKQVVSSGSIGNPALAYERAWNWELGVDLQVAKGVEIKSTVFRRNQQNLIDWVPTAYANMPRKDNLLPGGSYALASNISSVSTSGFEIDLRGIHKLGADHQLRWSSGFLVLQSLTPEGAPPSFYLSSHARLLLNNTLQWSHKGILISLTGLYKKRDQQKAAAIGAELSKSYFLVNARMQHQLLKNKAGLFLQADNLGNQSYVDLLGSIMPGRWWSGGVNLRIQ
jgi:vitamin B12 transporter